MNTEISRHFKVSLLHSAFLVLLSSNLVIISGCIADGSGTTHGPPKEVIAGAPTRFELRVSSGGINLNEQLSNVEMVYRIENDAEYQSLKMTIYKIEEHAISLHCVLSPISASNSGRNLEYYFRFKMGRKESKRDNNSLPFLVPIRSTSSANVNTNNASPNPTPSNP